MCVLTVSLFPSLRLQYIHSRENTSLKNETIETSKTVTATNRGQLATWLHFQVPAGQLQLARRLGHTTNAKTPVNRRGSTQPALPVQPLLSAKRNYSGPGRIYFDRL